MDSSAKELRSYIRQNERAIMGIARDGTTHQNLVFVIVNLIRRLERAHDIFPFEVMNQEELSTFKEKISLVSVAYKDCPCINSQMTCFRNHRAALINKLKSGACQLDINSFRITILRLFGYTVSIIKSLNLDEYLGRHLMEYCLKIPSFQNLSVRHLLIAASFFGPICLIASFAECLHSKYIVHSIINEIEENKMLFEKVINSPFENVVMQFLWAELFSKTTDEDIIKNVKYLAGVENLTSSEKIFASILVSSLKNDLSCIQDLRFLYKTYLFSRTEVAAVWYNRLSYYIDPSDQEDEIRILNDGLLHLKMIYLTSSPPAETFIFTLTPSILNRVILSGLHSLCFFYGIRTFKRENMFSKDLRKLALDSQIVLKYTRPALAFRH